MHKHRCQFPSITDAGRDFLCGLRISSYEAVGELGFNLQGGKSAAKDGGEEGGGTLFSEVHVAWHETKELLWQTAL